jgi:hypothetical protein
MQDIGAEQATTSRVETRAQRRRTWEDATSTQTPARKRPPPRQSELASKTDTQQVLQQILSTPCPLTVGDVLATSKELSTVLIDNLKVKTPSTSQAPPATVTSATAQDSDSRTEEPAKLFAATHTPLLYVTVHCNGLKYS